MAQAKMPEAQEMLCPFCGFKTESEYQIMLHLETLHAEGQSPFVAKDSASVVAMVNQDNVNYADCPIDGCGEMVLFDELDNHVEMHGEEDGNMDLDTPASGSSRQEVKNGAGKDASFGTKLTHALRNIDHGHDYEPREPPPAQAGTKAWRDILKMPDITLKSQSKPPPAKGTRQLGKAELGPHAHEKQMPSWLVKLLQADGQYKTINRINADGQLRRVKYCPNQADGIIPVLSQLLDQDRSVSYAYLCDPAVLHVSKLMREGGFCGYRNIQMMCSYIVKSQFPGHKVLGDVVPTIFDIQEYIESAWDQGINSQGRIETGGIRGTRKYIGTPDAQAMFCSLGIPCDTAAMKTRKDRGDPPAVNLLYSKVESYFFDGALDYNCKVRETSLPPIYFQHPGHSMTIIGFEKLTDGTKNLLVFDPMFHDSSKVVKLVGGPARSKHPSDLLKAYRRGNKYLKRYNEFELLKLAPQPRSKLN
ncbi:putative peptidase family c78 protein [Botrytis fragariae]|uniref:Putative peptidase family c78 protein n=1 Tax=Botrytis fragariae TaxID=1964551 RepID=A0A8H6B561_9HELO|nr:putative peptidase family c78 protein [Botrytis fragariae]KAF5879623.1 putative peptidase family c78 protein [Botrytis fragariae]